MLKVGLIEVIKKYATDTAGFIAMFEVEVLVTPGFVTGIIILSKRGQCIMAALMKMAGILLGNRVGRKFHATAKPEYRLILCIACMRNEKTHIHMTGGNIGVGGVQYQGDPHGLPGATLELAALRGG